MVSHEHNHIVPQSIHELKPKSGGIDIVFRDPSDPTNETTTIDYDMMVFWWIKKYVIGEIIKQLGESYASKHIPPIDILKYKTWQFFNRHPAKKPKKITDEKTQAKILKFEVLLDELIKKMEEEKTKLDEEDNDWFDQTDEF